MPSPPFSIILLPTLRCNADCAYCFEKKSESVMSLESLTVVVQKVMDHMQGKALDSLYVYWQGGEVMTLSPQWFAAAYALFQDAAEKRGLKVRHFLQSNMVAYTPEWERIIPEMFGNSVGSSMDFPNLHRKLQHGHSGEYSRLWTANVRQALAAGIEVGVIAIPNEQTLAMGAARFYAYFVDELGIKDFQINTPFPGGGLNAVTRGYPLDIGPLSAFLAELGTIWMARGFHHGVRIGPFQKLLEYFIHGTKDLLCIWRENCANDFICIDPLGNVAQCDCWVASYPESWFGNILAATSLTDILATSETRQRMQDRPGVLVQREDCLSCEYLSLCHGGCPVRAFTVHGTIFRKDPYCELYKDIFQNMEGMAAELSQKAWKRSRQP